jgi:hypothetical protein
MNTEKKIYCYQFVEQYHNDITNLTIKSRKFGSEEQKLIKEITELSENKLFNLYFYLLDIQEKLNILLEERKKWYSAVNTENRDHLNTLNEIIERNE